MVISVRRGTQVASPIFLIRNIVKSVGGRHGKSECHKGGDEPVADVLRGFCAGATWRFYDAERTHVLAKVAFGSMSAPGGREKGRPHVTSTG